MWHKGMGTHGGDGFMPDCASGLRAGGCPRSPVPTIGAAAQDVSLLPPSPPARHKIPIQAVNKKPFSRAFLGKGQARNFSLEDPLFPVYCSAHFFSLPAKYVFLCGENRPPFGQGSFALINRAVMHGHALAQRSQTNASFFVVFFFLCRNLRVIPREAAHPSQPVGTRALLLLLLLPSEVSLCFLPPLEPGHCSTVSCGPGSAPH